MAETRRGWSERISLTELCPAPEIKVPVVPELGVPMVSTLQLAAGAPAEFLLRLALLRGRPLRPFGSAALLRLLTLARGLGNLRLRRRWRRGANFARDRAGIAQPGLEIGAGGLGKLDARRLGLGLLGRAGDEVVQRFLRVELLRPLTAPS